MTYFIYHVNHVLWVSYLPPAHHLRAHVEALIHKIIYSVGIQYDPDHLPFSRVLWPDDRKQSWCCERLPDGGIIRNPMADILPILRTFGQIRSEVEEPDSRFGYSTL
jgi:hypothetical protein